MNSHIAGRYKTKLRILLALMSAFVSISTIAPIGGNAQDNSIGFCSNNPGRGCTYETEEKDCGPGNWCLWPETAIERSDVKVRPVLYPIIRFFLGFFTLITLIFIVYSGIKLLRVPTDDPIKKEGARRRLIIGVVIFVVMIILYVLTSFVNSSVIAQTN